MSEHVESVKRVAAYLRENAERRRSDPVHDVLMSYASARVAGLWGRSSEPPPDARPEAIAVRLAERMQRTNVASGILGQIGSDVAALTAPALRHR